MFRKLLSGIAIALALATSAHAYDPPGGSNTQVQFNDSGNFNGHSGLTYNKASSTLSVGVVLLTTPLAVLQGGTGVTTSTGSGAVVLNNGPTFIAPILGTPASGVATNLTGTAASLTAGNSNQLGGATFAAPGAIGGTTPGSVAATTLTTTSTIIASGTVTAPSYNIGTTLLRTGTGTPESAVTAPIGSLFLRTDGGANTTMYRKESGAGNTGWIAVTNAGGAFDPTAPGPIGGTTPGTGAFTTLTTTGTINASNDIVGTGQMEVAGVQKFVWTGRSKIFSPADGVVYFSDNAVATFSRLAFGGATSSFPSIKRSAAGMIARLADDTGDTTWTASQYTSTVTTGTAPLVVASTTVVANLNASQLGGATFASPGAIGGTTPAAGAFTTLSSSGLTTPNSLSVTTTASVTGVLTTASGVVRKIRVVTAAGAITGATTDDIIIVNKTVGATTVVNLPSGVSGQVLTIKDGKGDAATNPITITPAAGNIDNGATLIMNINKQSITIVYDGTQWDAI